jgi:hypothetical protein
MENAEGAKDAKVRNGIVPGRKAGPFEDDRKKGKGKSNSRSLRG